MPIAKNVPLKTKKNIPREKEMDGNDNGVEKLTPVQLERMRLNRERALELQEKKRKEREASVETGKKEVCCEDGDNENESWQGKKQKASIPSPVSGKDEALQPLEEFEVGAPDYITKKEAMHMYLLPEGTLAVCQFIEKENPRNRGWTGMKLYCRAEIRRRAHERWGGIHGLALERKKREEKRFWNDLEKNKNIFNNDK